MLRKNSTPDRIYPGYSQSVEVQDHRKLLFISGQVAVDHDGKVPDTFAGQAALVWKKVEAELTQADMRLEDLVKVAIYIKDPADAAENRAIRKTVLANCSPALVVAYADLMDEKWLIEVEGIACA